jgi:hypothetical protein
MCGFRKSDGYEVREEYYACVKKNTMASGGRLYHMFSSLFFLYFLDAKGNI